MSLCAGLMRSEKIKGGPTKEYPVDHTYGD